MKRVGKLLKISFYFILINNYPECVKFDEEQEITQSIKKKLSKNYVKLFSNLPQPKDEIVNLIIFCLGYINHFLFYQLFPKQRDLFDLRFIFNCYHILVFEFNGIFVSDFFVRMNIDKMFFQNKFLDYERVNKKNLLLQQQAKNKLKSRSFFGFQLSFPEINTVDGQVFTKQVHDKFKPVKKSVSNFQDDHLSNHISLQDKQDKIKHLLKEKRIKEIEEIEHKKINELLQIQSQINDPQQTSDINRSQRTIQIMKYQKQADAIKEKEDKFDINDDQKELTSLQQKLLANQIIANKLVQEKAEEIFEKTSIKNDQAQQKEEQNYFANLQMNCNQISPTVSNVLAYDSRTLPFAKKKMIRHAFETVNDKDDDLLNQLKLFSQSRKQKKETKNTQKSNKSIIDHFGLRPPPREYYQKHPKLDKMFKDMLDLNYVLKMNQESMFELPSSVQMQVEQTNEWQNNIVEQEQNYDKQNQRQKLQDSINEVISNNQKYELEKRAGYRKNFIYTKPLQYMKKSVPSIDTSQTQQQAQQQTQQQTSQQNQLQIQIKDATPQRSSILFGVKQQSSVPDLISQFQVQNLLSPVQQHSRFNFQNSLQPLSTRSKKDDNTPQTNLGSSTNQNLNGEKYQRNVSFLPNIEMGSFQQNDEILRYGSQLYNSPSSLMPSPQKVPNQSIFNTFSSKQQGDESNAQKSKRANQLQKSTLENSSANHRQIEFKIHEQDTKGKRGYYDEDSETIEQKILQNKQNKDFYNDKRNQYREKYKGYLNNMSTDNNIEDIMQNILHKRNQFNKGLKSKVKNL